jgi:NADH-quinone oxidoreductase subunit F
MTWEEFYGRAIARVREQREDRVAEVLVGDATCGRAAGSGAVIQAFRDSIARLGINAIVTPVGCMGLCYAEPLAIIRKPGELQVIYHHVTPEIADRLVQNYLIGDDPGLEWALGSVEEGPTGAWQVPELERFSIEQRVLLRNCGRIDPEDIYPYAARGGYRALFEALAGGHRMLATPPDWKLLEKTRGIRSVPPEDIIQLVKLSGLRGRGGAGFPTGAKWELCAQTPSDIKYVICNADEGDPGAFMDRVILESDPHSVIEGMIIAAYAVGAQEGYLYTRAEYPLAIARLETALGQAAEQGLLGEDILGSGFSFKLSIARGAGAFVSGESTALMRALEGERSTPRPRPPHSAVSGLWGKPTVLNNVKTFACVPLVLEHKWDWVWQTGTDGSKGTTVFALAGKLVNTGLAEVPMGTTLRKLIYDIGGGMRDGKAFKAVQVGGPSGGCLPESLLDTPVDFDSLKAAGAPMGSGGLIAMDSDNCVVDTARYFLDFTQKESCGKCSFCRIGTKQMLEILNDICAGRGQPGDLALLQELAEDVAEGALCGLGQNAPNPVLTTLRYFRDEYRAHIEEKRCPALVCPELTAYWIIPDKCDRGCEHCVLVCPAKAISGEKGEPKVIDQNKCTKCGTCLEKCPVEYQAIIKVSPLSALPK